VNATCTPPRARPIGLVAASPDGPATDAVPTRILGFDGDGVRTIDFAEIDLNLRFAPRPGWAGRIERDERGSAACAS